MKSKHVQHIGHPDLWRLTIRGGVTPSDDTTDSVVGFNLLTEYRNVGVRKERRVKGVCAFPWSVSGVSTFFCR